MELSLPAEKAISLSGCSNARSSVAGAALPTINYPKIDQFIERVEAVPTDGSEEPRYCYYIVCHLFTFSPVSSCWLPIFIAALVLR